MTCIVAIVAFASHKDRNILKHYVVPGLGTLMNVGMLVGVVYLAIVAGGATSTDAYIALGIVGVWILAGAAWIALNPAKRGESLVAVKAAA